jgi:hypothetical protein
MNMLDWINGLEYNLRRLLVRNTKQAQLFGRKAHHSPLTAGLAVNLPLKPLLDGTLKTGLRSSSGYEVKKYLTTSMGLHLRQNGNKSNFIRLSPFVVSYKDEQLMLKKTYPGDVQVYECVEQVICGH